MNPREDDFAPNLSERIQEVQHQLHELGARISALELKSQHFAVSPEPERDEAMGSAWSWTTPSKVLPQIAVLSFALVIALLLRTLTDGGVLGRSLGTILGLGYPALLIVWGWRSLSRGASGQLILPLCGDVLLCSVVLEAHTRFQSLSAPAANAVLFGGLVAMTWLGVHYRAPLLAQVSALATALTALAIGFPDLHFPSTVVVLLLANAAAFVLLRVAARTWLQWVMLILTVFFWVVWTSKIYAVLSRREAVPPTLYLTSFLPMLGVSFAFYLLLAARSLWPATAPTPFALVLPSVNVLGALGAASAGIVPWLAAGRHWLGAFGLLAAVLHLALAFRVGSRDAVARESRGFTAFALAAIFAFAPATWLAIGYLTATLPLWSLAALGLAWLSARHGSGGLRVSSYALQASACLVGVAAGEFAASAQGALVRSSSGAVLATVAWLHYRSSRAGAPVSGRGSSRSSPADHLGVATLWVSVLAWFCSLRVLASWVLASLPIDADNAFRCSQSVILNGIALGLMVLGLRRRNKEILTTAIVVAAVGGVKVFASDLFTTQGVPLVLGVFSVGIVAAVGSIIVRRWQRQTGECRSICEPVPGGQQAGGDNEDEASSPLTRPERETRPA